MKNLTKFILTGRVALVGLIGLFSFAASAQDTYYVDANASGGNNGNSWGNAYTDLQAALGAAGSGDSIFVAAGTYKPTTGASREETFSIPGGVLVYGGFAGGEANLAARDLSAGNETILSGDLGTAIGTLGDFDDAGYDDNTYNVVSMTNADAHLDGFTVQGGKADGNEPANSGGGIYVTAAVTLRYMTVHSNIAIGYGGGGIYLQDPGTAGEIKVTHCTIYNNMSGAVGGGLQLVNFLTTGTAGKIKVTHCMIYDNEATGRGGGIHAGNGEGDFSIENCAIYGNKSGSDGGGVFLQNDDNGTATTKTINCTIYANMASDDGGGIYFDNAPNDAMIVVGNCLIYGNTAADAHNVTKSFSRTRLTNCLLGEALTGLTNSDEAFSLQVDNLVMGDPLFASTDRASSVFLRLGTGSPALNSGNYSLIVIPRGINLDLAGNDRREDSQVDIGAYEGEFDAPSGGASYTLVTGSPNVDENATSGDLSALNVVNGDAIASFEVSEGGTTSTDFEVVDKSGTWTLQVAAGANLDAETATSQVITIQGKDANNQNVGSSINATIAINDVNDEAPTTPALSLPANNAVATYTGNIATITAPTAANAVLLNAMSTDNDVTTANNTVTYSLTAVAPTTQASLDAILAIDASGVITLVNALTTADNASHTFKVVASDGVAGTADAETPEQTLAINISATAASYNLATASPNVNENANSGNLSALNVINGDAIASFEVSEGNVASSNFEIVDENGTWTLRVASGADLDAETATSQVITIQGKDGGGQNVGSSINATIAINDVNDEAPTAPVLSLPANNAVAAYTGNTATITVPTAANAVLLNAMSTDDDVTAANNTVTYRLAAAGATTQASLDAMLAVDASGVIQLVGALTTADNGMHAFKVIASDGGSETADAETPGQTLAINISATAVGYTLLTASPNVDEDRNSGTEISGLNVINGGAIARFEVSEGGTTSTDFEVVDKSGTWTLQVASGATLDAEMATSQVIIIQGKDGNNNDVGNGLNATIAINDVNDEAPTPPELSLPANDAVATYTGNIATITAPTAADAVLLNATSTDDDATAANNTVTYSLEAVAPTTPVDLDAILAIDASGVITIKKALSEADDASHLFKVVASDGGSETSDAKTIDQTLRISIGDSPLLGLSDADGYSVYPNPVSGDEVLQVSGVAGDRVEVLDVSGRVLTDRTLRGAIDELPVANLRAGTYLVRITPANGKRTVSKVLRFIRE